MPLFIHGTEVLLWPTLIRFLGKNSSYIDVKIGISFLYNLFESLILFTIPHQIPCKLALKGFIRFLLTMRLYEN